MKKHLLCFCLIFTLLLAALSGCDTPAPPSSNHGGGGTTDGSTPPAAPTLNGAALESFVIVCDLEAKNSAAYLKEEIAKSFGFDLPVLEESALTGGENVIFVGNFGPLSYGIRYGISAKEMSGGNQHVYLSADTAQNAFSAVNRFVLEYLEKKTVIEEPLFHYVWQEEDLAAELVLDGSETTALADGLSYIRRNYTRADGDNLDVYIAVISPALVPYLALTAPPAGEVATTSAQAKTATQGGKNVAIAVNAGFFDIHKTNLPTGTCIIDGTVMQRPVPSTSHKDLWFGVTNEGEAVISNAMKYADVYEGKLNFAVGGHKLIIQNGKFYARSTVLNPLTTVGVCADGSVVIVCVDGRSAQSAGASYADIAQIYAELEMDVVTVLCLDGGGSTTFVTKSGDDFKIENAPSDGKERKVQSVLLVKLP